MTHSRKVLVNTIAVYIKIIINTIITLISTRIVLRCLGVNDFGLYSLISSVIVLLSFLNGALMVSTQRYLSIAIGEKNKEKLSQYFNSSFLIHTILAMCLILVLLLLQPLLINHILNIPIESHMTSHVIYDIMIVSSAFTLFQVPYSAAMNAHEDIYVWAVTEVLNCLLRLGASIALLFIVDNKLEIYTALILLALLVSAGMKYWWCRVKYAESRLIIEKMKNKVMLKEMFGFVGWNTLGSSAVLIRNQGVAVLLNVFFGVLVNAAYGIANQVNGLVMTLASTITTVFSPSIMQAYGAGDSDKMIRVAIISSKLSFLISSITAIPLMVFMPEIFKIWLGDIPQYSVEFCSLMMYVFVIMQLTSGLNRVIYAVGEIKWYQITLSMILFAIIPAGYILFNVGYHVNVVFYVMIVAQLLMLIVNIYFSYKSVKYDVVRFSVQSILLPMLLFVGIVEGTIYCYGILEFGILTKIAQMAVVVILYLFLYVNVVFASNERDQILKFIRK